MDLVFVELPFFEMHRKDYLTDEDFRLFQEKIMENPDAGDVIKGTGGLRKIRFKDSRRKKGARGGLRVIYYYWDEGSQVWLFTIYDKDEMSDLSSKERSALAEYLKSEIEERRKEA